MVCSCALSLVRAPLSFSHEADAGKLQTRAKRFDGTMITMQRKGSNMSIMDHIIQMVGLVLILAAACKYACIPVLWCWCHELHVNDCVANLQMVVFWAVCLVCVHFFMNVLGIANQQNVIFVFTSLLSLALPRCMAIFLFHCLCPHFLMVYCLCLLQQNNDTGADADLRWEDMTIVGTCQDLEKPYLRLTSVSLVTGQIMSLPLSLCSIGDCVV